VDTIYLGTQDVLKICGTGDDVAESVACALHRPNICDLEVRQNLDKHFCGKIEKGACRKCCNGSISRLDWVDLRAIDFVYAGDE